MKFILSKKLSHLSSSEIESLYQRYLQGEKIKELLVEYNIDESPSRLYTLFPAIESKTHSCPYCKNAMYLKAASKTNQHIEHYFCQSCSHTLNLSNGYIHYKCSCEKCREAEILKKQKQYEEAKQRIKEEYALNKFPLFPYSSLTLKDKCFLYSLYLLNNDKEYILPLRVIDRITPITPNEVMTDNMIYSLFQRNILIVSPTSDPEAFIGDNFENPSLYYVDWAINIKDKFGNRLTLETLGKDLHNDLVKNLEYDYDEIITFIDKLLLEELHAYLNYKLDELYLPPAPKKVSQIFQEILSDFSVSEIYYFIKKACEDALLFYTTGRSMGKKHAVNIIPTKIINLAQRSLNEGWKRYAYNRQNTMQRSQLSIIFFDLILKGRKPDSGFYLNRKELLEHLENHV